MLLLNNKEFAKTYLVKKYFFEVFDLYFYFDVQNKVVTM